MKVLLIRRASESLRTAVRLKEAGFETEVFSLFEKRGIAHQPRLTEPDFLVFTSAAGAESFSLGSIEVNWDIPVYSVGPRTSEALVEIGYKNIRQGDGDAQQLAQRIIAEQSANMGKGIHVCGEDRAFDLTAALKVHSIELELCVAYRIEAIVPDRTAFEYCMNSLKDGFVFLYSPASARHFSKLIGMLDLTDKSRLLSVVAISEKTSLAASNGLVKNIYLAENPNEQAMIDKLIEVSGRNGRIV